jgi:hypothetical protein
MADMWDKKGKWRKRRESHLLSLTAMPHAFLACTGALLVHVGAPDEKTGCIG